MINYQSVRKNWIDWAKALGILLVVMGHSNYSQSDINPMIFMIHMPLFFVASGYLFNTNKTLKEITQSNIRTLLIPYLLFNLIPMIYHSSSAFMKQVMGAEVDWNGQIFQPLCDTLLGVPGNLLCGPTWFLLALIWCKYIIYGIEKSKPTIGFFIIFIWLVVLVTIQFVDVKLPLSIGGGYFWLLVVCSGILHKEIFSPDLRKQMDLGFRHTFGICCLFVHMLSARKLQLFDR